MPDLKDLHNNIARVSLKTPDGATSADAYSKYIDTQGYNGVEFVVHALASVADDSNYFTPKVYGYTGDTPGTASNYTACDSGELNGSFSAINDTNAYIDSVGLLQHLYRYYMIMFDETSTAVAEISAHVELSAREQPANDDSPTTGAVT